MQNRNLTRFTFLALVFSFSILGSALPGQSFNTVASATNLGNNCWELTPNQVNRNGAIWNTQALNLNNPFDLTFHVTQTPAGADGLAFVLQTNSTNIIGGGGNNLGYANGSITNLVAVELDIFNNSGAGIDDIPQNHIAIHRNSNLSNAVFGPVTALPTGNAITDGVCRPFRIVWNPSTNNLQVHFDGNQRLNVTYNLRSILSSNTAFWGITASTGGTGCRQSVCYEFANAGQDTAICESTTLQLSGSGGATYFWVPTTGLSNPSLPNPVFTPYSGTGTYSYVLGVSNSLGCSDTNAISIEVEALPTANAGNNRGICPGDTTTLGAPGQSGLSYSWTPTTNLLFTTSALPEAFPTSTTTYTLTVTDQNGQAGCSATDQVTVNMLATPTANAGPDRTICLGDTAMIGAGSQGFTSYLWSPASSLGTPTASSTTAFPNSTTDFVLTATLNITGCQKRDTVTVTVNTPPIADAGPDLGICENNCDTIGTPSLTGLAYAWTPSTGLSSSTVANPEVCPANSGSYLLLVTDTATGCFSSDSVDIILNPNPVANAGPDLNICENNCDTLGAPALSGFAYAWTPSISLSDSAAANPEICPANSGSYVLMVTDIATGCFGSDSVDVTLNPNPIVNLGPDQSICETFCVQLNGGGLPGVTCSWSPGLYLDDSTISNPTACPPVDICYQLICTDNGTGCVGVDTVCIDVLPLPFVDAGVDTAICEGDSVQLNGLVSAGASVQWSPSADLSDPQLVNPFAFPTAPTEFILAAVDSGCSNQDTVFVDVNPAPVAGFSASVSQLDVDFTVTGSTGSYSWDFGDGSTDTAAAPSHSYDSSGTYVVCLNVMTPEGCSNKFCDSVSVMGVGFADELSGLQAMVYPNPAHGFVKVKLEGSMEKHADWSLLDLRGLEVVSGTFDQPRGGRIELLGMAKGVYFLRLRVGERVKIFKILVE